MNCWRCASDAELDSLSLLCDDCTLGMSEFEYEQHVSMLTKATRENDMAMVDDFGNSKVTVKKSELLEKIKKNREGHRAEFIKAQDGFRAYLIRELEKRLVDARELRKVAGHFSLVEPEDHTKDYDRVIMMLEMSTSDDIVITEKQFQQYVMDDWNWMASFKNSTSNYIGDPR